MDMKKELEDTEGTPWEKTTKNAAKIMDMASSLDAALDKAEEGGAEAEGEPSEEGGAPAGSDDDAANRLATDLGMDIEEAKKLVAAAKDFPGTKGMEGTALVSALMDDPVLLADLRDAAKGGGKPAGDSEGEEPPPAEEPPAEEPPMDAFAAGPPGMGAGPARTGAAFGPDEWEKA